MLHTASFMKITGRIYKPEKQSLCLQTILLALGHKNLKAHICWGVLQSRLLEMRKRRLPVKRQLYHLYM